MALPKPEPAYSMEPKFVYRRNVKSFTRKSNYVNKDTNLVLNKAVKQNFSKQSGKEYPSTKPMVGWEKVYVGSGRVKGKVYGRKSKNKLVNDVIIKPKKARFEKFVGTYKKINL